MESTPIITDRQLLHLIAQGNRLALQQVYNRFWKRLYLYAFKIFRDEQACEDIVQEVFVKLWENASCTQINHLESYLLQSVKYKALNAIRDIKWSCNHEQILSELVGELSSDGPVEHAEMQKKITDSMQMLPTKCREVFELFHHKHLSTVEIAESLNISSRTVETHIYHARQILRKQLFKSANLWKLLSSSLLLPLL